MTAAGSARKGREFERRIAHDVQRAFRVPARECYRTPLSGGHPYGQQGDLVLGPALRARFPFLVECKHRRWWRLWHLFEPNAQMVEWLRGAAEQAARAGLRPLLVVRGQRTPVMAVIGAPGPLGPSRALRADYGVPVDGRRGAWVVMAWPAFLRLAGKGLWPDVSEEA